MIELPTQVLTVKGVLPLEDYVARVTQCENGGAPPESLKAQAVAARTYLLFNMETRPGFGVSQQVPDGQSFQVFSNDACKLPVTTQPRQSATNAAQMTAGVVIIWNDDLITANFVEGSPDRSEKFVTYNEGLTGSDVKPSSIAGHIAANRGCMGQNKANALAKSGYDWQAILRYFYGADVQFLDLATGQLVGPSFQAPPVATIAPSSSVGRNALVLAGGFLMGWAGLRWVARRYKPLRRFR